MEDKLFGRSTAKEYRHLVLQFLARHKEAVSRSCPSFSYCWNLLQETRSTVRKRTDEERNLPLDDIGCSEQPIPPKGEGGAGENALGIVERDRHAANRSGAPRSGVGSVERKSW